MHDVAGQFGKFAGFTQARREGDAGGQRLLDRLGQARQQGCLEQAWRDGAHADAVLCQVACHGQRHADHTGLGGTVGLLAHLPVKGGNGRGENHDATGTVFHGVELSAGLSKQTRRVVGADQVDVDDLGEFLQRCGFAVFTDHALGGADAGDLHQDAGRAVGCGGRLDGLGHAVCIAHVAVHCDAANVSGHALGVGHVQVEHRDLGAQTGQFAGRGLAQTRATAGDQCCLSLDVHVSSFLSEVEPSGPTVRWVVGAKATDLRVL